MSEAPDPLEAELSALRPQEVTPGLRQRIAQRLADARPVFPPRRRWVGWAWRLALAGGMAVALLATVVVRWGGGPRTQPERFIVQPQPPPPVAGADPAPQVLAYERALARSPEAFDAVLDKDAAVTPERNPECVRMVALPRSEAEWHALLGED
jgi:hypothetical protein